MKRIAILAGFVVVACTQVTSGTVTSRYYTPEWWSTTTSCVMYDNKGNCRFYQTIPVDNPAEYTLCLRDDSEDRPVDKRDTGCVDVTPTEYERYHEGDHYP